MAVKKLRNYEMMVALKPLLPDDLRKQLHKQFVDAVKKSGGDVFDVDVWGKRYLAYDIKGHNEAYYMVYSFTEYPENIIEIKRQFELKPEVLRFLIVQMDDISKVGKGIKKKELEI